MTGTNERIIAETATLATATAWAIAYAVSSTDHSQDSQAVQEVLSVLLVAASAVAVALGVKDALADAKVTTHSDQVKGERAAAADGVVAR